MRGIHPVLMLPMHPGLGAAFRDTGSLHFRPTCARTKGSAPMTVSRSGLSGRGRGYYHISPSSC